MSDSGEHDSSNESAQNHAHGFSSGVDQAEALSPIIHSSYIDPCASKPDSPGEMVAYDQASAAFAVPSTVPETSQELQGLLVQFDPLTLSEGPESTTTSKADNSSNSQHKSTQNLIDFGDEQEGQKDEQLGKKLEKLQEEAPPTAQEEDVEDGQDRNVSTTGSQEDSQPTLEPTSGEPSDDVGATESSDVPSHESIEVATGEVSPDTKLPASASTDKTTGGNTERGLKLQRFPSKTSINDIPRDDENTDRPFDFQRFLDQLRHKSADPIARYVKSFLTEFNKRPWTCEEQVKIIGDFKNFITGKMELCPPFSALSEHEMMNATEGMEKLIMNRLYAKTFSPEIPQNLRAGGHEEDIIHDRIVEEKVRIWSWIEARHLDLPDRFLRNGEAFIKLASDELSKINHYRAPRDKVICILNCCKVIFGLLRQTKSEESADGFLPLLIYVVIKAQPKDPISNINYIQRFRSPDRLNGETGYYLSSLIGAISFIEQLDRSQLSVTDEEFETNMESTIKAIVTPTEANEEKAKGKVSRKVLLKSDGNEPPSTPDRQSSPVVEGPSEGQPTQPKGPSNDPHTAEKHNESNKGQGQGQGHASSGESLSSGAVQGLNPSQVLYNSAGLFAAPFKSLSKIFESDPANADEAATASTQQVKEASNTSSTNASVLLPEELAARQVSAEEHEARRIHQKEFDSVVVTLKQMFPLLDKEIIEDVLTQKEGRVGAAVDACLLLVDTS